MPVEIEFFISQCLDTAIFMGEATEALKDLRASGRLTRRWTDNMARMVEELRPAGLTSPPDFLQTLANGAGESIDRRHVTGGGVLLRAGYVYVWAAFENLLSTLILELQRARPDLVTEAEVKSFPFWKPRDQLRLLRRVGFRLRSDWRSTFARFARLRDAAAHEPAFPVTDLTVAEQDIGALQVAGQNFAVFFARQYGLPFRLFGLERLPPHK